MCKCINCMHLNAFAGQSSHVSHWCCRGCEQSRHLTSFQKPQLTTRTIFISFFSLSRYHKAQGYLTSLANFSVKSRFHSVQGTRNPRNRRHELHVLFSILLSINCSSFSWEKNNAKCILVTIFFADDADSKMEITYLFFGKKCRAFFKSVNRNERALSIFVGVAESFILLNTLWIYLFLDQNRDKVLMYICLRIDVFHITSLVSTRGENESTRRGNQESVH